MVSRDKGLLDAGDFYGEAIKGRDEPHLRQGVRRIAYQFPEKDFLVLVERLGQDAKQFLYLSFELV